MTETKSPVPESHHDLLGAPSVAHLATVRPDGQVQSNPVWIEWDGEHVKISQTRDRQKFANMQHDPHVALSVADSANPYRYVEVRGVVERVEDDPDYAFIDHLAEQYLGQKPYPWHRPGDERVIVYIRPVGVSAI